MNRQLECERYISETKQKQLGNVMIDKERLHSLRLRKNESSSCSFDIDLFLQSFEEYSNIIHSDRFSIIKFAVIHKSRLFYTIKFSPFNSLF